MWSYTDFCRPVLITESEDGSTTTFQCGRAMVVVDACDTNAEIKGLAKELMEMASCALSNADHVDRISETEHVVHHWRAQRVFEKLSHFIHDEFRRTHHLVA